MGKMLIPRAMGAFWSLFNLSPLCTLLLCARTGLVPEHPSRVQLCVVFHSHIYRKIFGLDGVLQRLFVMLCLLCQFPNC